MNEFQELCNQYSDSERQLIVSFVYSAYDNDKDYVMTDETKEYLLKYIDTSSDVFFSKH